MKHRKKIKFRIWVWCSIALFLLIPLLSLPVTAAFTQSHGSVWTDNKDTDNPTCGGSTPTGGTIFDSSPYNGRFSLTYAYKDSTSTGSGSDHWMVIRVWHQPGGNGPYYGPNTTTQTKITLGPGGNSSGTFYSNWTLNYGGTGTNFEVIVWVYCYDIDSMKTSEWGGPGQTYTVS